MNIINIIFILKVKHNEELLCQVYYRDTIYKKEISDMPQRYDDDACIGLYSNLNINLLKSYINGLAQQEKNYMWTTPYKTSETKNFKIIILKNLMIIMMMII